MTVQYFNNNNNSIFCIKHCVGTYNIDMIYIIVVSSLWRQNYNSRID